MGEEAGRSLPLGSSSALGKRLEAAAGRLAARLDALDVELEAGGAVWPEYAALAGALATVVAQLVPGARGELLTTAQMAERLHVKPKTLLKWRKAGKVTPAEQLGKRGRAAIRWKGMR
jgi:Helix-turn-helix domain